jgi:acyl-CoA dehydrogenase
MRLAGEHAVRAPIGEASAAGYVGAKAGIALGESFSIVAPRAHGTFDGGQRFTGRIEGAAWGGDAEKLIFVLDGRVGCVAVKDACEIKRRENPAGEARDTLVFDGAVAACGSAVNIFACGALVRTAQIAGALDAALFMALEHANGRVQFDRPIGKFQAVQQGLAMFAQEAAAVNCGGQAAARVADQGDASFEIAAAKLRANMASGVGVAIAHQVHGAIGFTQEYQLHPLTRRLISWRSEFGNDRYWSEFLGDVAARTGADELWPFLTSRGDRV